MEQLDPGRLRRPAAFLGPWTPIFCTARGGAASRPVARLRTCQALSQTTAKPPGPGFRPLIGSIDEYLGRLAAAWVARVQRRAGAVILVFLVATIGIGAYAAATLGINSSEIDIFSKDLRVMSLRADYLENFPELRDPIVVVVDAE